MIRPSLITVTTDFGVQSQGTGILEGTAYRLAPSARFIHYMHGLPPFDITAAARTLETLCFIPIGIHVCVCDPGVGTRRRALVCKMGRGDLLIGPDNGVLVPAARFLGGLAEARDLTNRKLMNDPVSPLFHGRDVFVPAAAHLANGVALEECGPEIGLHELHAPPYDEAVFAGAKAHAHVLHINRFGSLHVNITHEAWDALGIPRDTRLRVQLPPKHDLSIPFVETFGDVMPGEPLIVKDDYGRMELAINKGSFAETFAVVNRDQVIISLEQSRRA